MSRLRENRRQRDSGVVGRQRSGSFRALTRIIVGALVATSMAGLGLLQAAAPAHAESTTLRSSSNPFYVFLKAGDTIFVDSQALGAVLDQNAASATPSAPGIYGPATEDGIWQVNIGQISSASSMRPWEIVARDGNGIDVPGRVWSTLFGTYQSAAANLRYWVVNDTGYQYQVSFDGYHGIESRIRADAIGNPIDKSVCTPSYQSKQTDGLDNGWDRIPNCGNPFRIFFAPPAADLPAEAKLGGADVPVLPAPVETSDLAINDLTFTPATRGSANGAFTWSLTDRFVGSYWLEIDVDGDGAYDGPRDRRIQQYADGSGSYTAAFDGLDANAQPIADCSIMRARIQMDKIGEVHFVQDDVEARAGGIEVIRLNGPNSPDATIYWDDTKLTGARANSTPVLDGTAGVDSTGGVHGWAFNNNSWGNDRVIEDWTYTPLDETAAEIEISSGCLSITKVSDATAETRVGDTVNYTVTAENTGSAAYTATNPAVVFDDLAGVLDDATFNGDAQASIGAVPSYTQPLLSWTGALGVGESVILTYSVTVTAGGDGTARNVAWVPNDPENAVTPSCDSPVDGADPATGEPCAVAQFELPKLVIAKTADRVELPAVGETVEYTIDVRNVGPGDFTTGNPATFVDDLSDVIDDATFDGSAVASVGAASFNTPELSWQGVLAAGESATVTYSVTYTGEGDQRLVNVACLPASDTAAGAERCALASVPGARLTQWKTVESSDSPAVAGSVLTYTLHFSNDGGAPATVDSVDLLAHVLDDADVTVEPVGSTGLNAARAGDRIAITGTVDPGEAATVVYEVTLKADGDRGDDIAANYLLTNDPLNPPTAPGAPVCTPQNPALPSCTVTPIAAVTYAKSVSASTAPIATGTVLTYTITITSTGTATTPVSRDDVLADVLDDATLSDVPASDTSSVTVGGIVNERFHLGGDLAGGATAVVTYRVTVNDVGSRGNNIAANFLVGEGEAPPTACVDGSTDCTVTPLPAVSVTKSADPVSGTEVAAGDEVTYTLTFVNNGEATGGADYTDDLSGVLDDADLTGQPIASAASLNGAVAASAIRITGSIDAGATTTVRYTVTVRSDSARGDDLLRNVVAITGTAPVCDLTAQNCTEHPIKLTPVPSGPNATPGDWLATTGGALSPWILALLVLLPVGVGLVARSRQRRIHTEQE